MTEPEMHETILGLYEGMHHPTAWRRALVSLRDTSGSAHASIVWVERTRDRLSVSRIAHTEADNADTGARQYAPHDPSLAFTAQLTIGQWHIGARMLGLTDAVQHFTDAATPADTPATVPLMVCLADRNPAYEIYLCLRRTMGQPAYDSGDARALDWVVPHLRHAVALRHRAQSDAMVGRASADVIDRLPFAVMVLREQGELILANTAGEAWARRLMPHGTGQAGIPAGGSHPQNGWRLSRPFSDVLRAACDPGSLAPAHAIQAKGTDGRTAQIVAISLRTAEMSPTALVAVHENHGPPPLAIGAILRDLYTLTPAESRLATLMMSGVGLPEACAQLGIKRETSRTQLKSIFTKTGTGTQAQLAHLLTRLSTVLARPA